MCDFLEIFLIYCLCFQLTGNYVRNMAHDEISLQDIKVAMNADRASISTHY